MCTVVHVLYMYVYLYACINIISAWKNGWQVISPKKSFAVFAATKTEKEEWMAHIKKCVADLLSKGILYTLAWLLYVYKT